MKEYEEEERQKRLGPGGLDPVEVYESLPLVSSQEAFLHTRLFFLLKSTQLTKYVLNCRRCRNVLMRRTLGCSKK